MYIYTPETYSPFPERRDSKGASEWSQDFDFHSENHFKSHLLASGL